MDLPSDPLPPDEVNRLWQHGMHEERLFHDRLNYFSGRFYSEYRKGCRGNGSYSLNRCRLFPAQAA